MVEAERLEDAAEIAAVRALVERHRDLTGSARAAALLQQWDRVVPRFVKVMPKDYKRVLACIRRAHDQGLSGDEAIMVAFEENARDLARVGGN
jgi:glutamate synthase (ferredoxin)